MCIRDSFKDAVLGLLHRDPAQRTLVQTFVQQYACIMAPTTEQHTPELTNRVTLSAGGSSADVDSGPLPEMPMSPPDTQYATAVG